MNEQKMFCWQCQETAGNKGCTVCGVCGKTADVAALQMRRSVSRKSRQRCVRMASRSTRISTTS